MPSSLERTATRGTWPISMRSRLPWGVSRAPAPWSSWPTGSATSSSRLRWLPAGSSALMPYQSSFKLPSGRDRLVMPSCPWSSSRGNQSSPWAWPGRAGLHSQRAVWRWPLISIRPPSIRPPWRLAPNLGARPAPPAGLGLGALRGAGGRGGGGLGRAASRGPMGRSRSRESRAAKGTPGR